MICCIQLIQLVSIRELAETRCPHTILISCSILSHTAVETTS